MLSLEKVKNGLETFGYNFNYEQNLYDDKLIKITTQVLMPSYWSVIHLSRGEMIYRNHIPHPTYYIFCKQRCKS